VVKGELLANVIEREDAVVMCGVPDIVFHGPML